MVFFNEQHTDIPYLLHPQTAESLFLVKLCMEASSWS